MFSFEISASDIMSNVVLWRKCLSEFLIGFQLSCCGQGMLSLHISSPTMQLSSGALPSMISTIS